MREICLGTAVDLAAQQWGDQTGWVFGARRVSFNELRDQSERVARALLASSVGAGDVVAVLTPNIAEFAFLIIGCSRIGAVLAPINTRSRTFELTHILQHSEAKLLVMVDQLLKQDFRELVSEVLEPGAWRPDGAVASAALPSLARIVTLSEADEEDQWAAFLGRGDPVPVEQLREAEQRQHWSQPVLLQYTSGTTASPKGALLNHRYILNCAVELIVELGVGEGEAFLNTQPFYHQGGSCGALPVPLSRGCRMVVPEIYDPEIVLGLIESERCVTRFGFSAMYQTEMRHPRFDRYDLSSLRTAWCVAPQPVMEQIRDRMGIEKIVQVYGSTEACGTFGRLSDPWDIRIRSAGKPYTGVELKIIDPATGKELPAGQRGEILLRGWAQMNGYLKRPEETAKTLDAEGWIHSGDIGRLDEDGNLYFVGRIKNMIRVGGENVSAEEVEALLLSHPKVKLAAAFSAPHERLQEVVGAAVELVPGETATEQEIIDFCARRVANFRVPRSIHFVTEWPMTGSGKIQVFLLRESLLGKAASASSPQPETV